MGSLRYTYYCNVGVKKRNWQIVVEKFGGNTISHECAFWGALLSKVGGVWSEMKWR
jgi:hypothetical protein